MRRGATRTPDTLWRSVSPPRPNARSSSYQADFLFAPPSADMDQHAQARLYAIVYAPSVSENRVAGDLIRLARAKAGLTQDEVGARAGVAQSLISAYENGRRQPTVPTLLRLLEAAGFDLRMRLEAPDLQSRAAQEWASTRPGPERRRWEREQRSALSGR